MSLLATFLIGRVLMGGEIILSTPYIFNILINFQLDLIANFFQYAHVMLVISELRNIRSTTGDERPTLGSLLFDNRDPAVFTIKEGVSYHRQNML